jgi:peptidoglycan hydrolase-like protein with peptidoglycan-binding domain
MTNQRLCSALCAITALIAPLFSEALVMFPTDLRPGLKNEISIVVLQKFLKSERLYAGTLTGVYDSSTRAAVELFQNKMRISPRDGIFSGKTRVVANHMIEESIVEYRSSKGIPTSTQKGPSKSAQPKLIEDSKPKVKLFCKIADSVYLPHGKSATYFRYTAPPSGSACQSQKRTCDDGYVDGDPGYRYTTCTAKVAATNIDTTATTRTPVRARAGVLNSTPERNEPTQDSPASASKAQKTTAAESEAVNHQIVCRDTPDSSGKEIHVCGYLSESSVCNLAAYPCHRGFGINGHTCLAKLSSGACPQLTPAR